MNIYKADTMLIIIGMILFGILVGFATGFFDPLVEKIGTGFTTMVDNIFSGYGIP